MKKLLAVIAALVLIGAVIVAFSNKGDDRVSAYPPEDLEDLYNKKGAKDASDKEVPNKEQPEQPMAQERQTIVMKTNQGDITFELFNDKSPKTVENFVKLAKDGFYDDTRFHRVIKDFMIQGGDPQSKDVSLAAQWGTGGPGYQFEDEFNDEPLVRGSLAMANSGPNTNGSQFFIVTLDATPWLDGKHTNFGKVTDGLDIAMGIEQTATGPGDRPLEDMMINSIEIK